MNNETNKGEVKDERKCHYTNQEYVITIKLFTFIENLHKPTLHIAYTM